MNPTETRWIALDWGTSTLRAWAMSARHTVLDKASSTQGMATVAAKNGDFESALLKLITPWLPNGRTTQVIACGMVGARGGWFEVPYQSTPCPPTTPLHQITSKSQHLQIHILAGIKQQSPPDVMRGEETQIAGLLHANPDFQGTICLPGTHTKWVTIKNGHIQQFRTYLTGELFDLLTTRSILAQTTATDGFEEPEFLSAFHETLTNPQHFLTQTFALRPAALLDNLSPTASRSRLSGHLIGLELSGTTSLAPLTEVALIGTPILTRAYQLALSSLDIKTTTHAPTQTTLDGLRLARHSISK